MKGASSFEIIVHPKSTARICLLRKGSSSIIYSFNKKLTECNSDITHRITHTNSKKSPSTA